MSLFLYFDANHAIEVHDTIIERSGGLQGIRDNGQLESILEHVQNDLYYPTILEKTVHVFYSFNKGHVFSDGNKRSSLALSAYFLEINGYDFIINKFISEMENIAVSVADNLIDKDLLSEIVGSILFEYEYSDELKMKIINALSNNSVDRPFPV